MLAVYLLFSVACFLTVHEHFLQGFFIVDSGDIPVGVMEQAGQQFSLDQGQYHAEHKQSQGQAEVAVHGV